MFLEIWTLGLVNFDLHFVASNSSFVPGRHHKPKVQTFRSGNQINPDRKVDMNFWVPGTYEHPPGDL